MIDGCILCRLLDYVTAERADALERGDFPAFIEAELLKRDLTVGYEERPA
jgi:hypothetical protein